MSQSRKDLIAQYDIKEPALKELLDDLCSKPEDANNITIIKKALRGIYSDFGSPLAMPELTLNEHLKQAGYPDLAAKVYTGNYDHNYGPKPSAANPNFAAATQHRKDQEQSMANSMFSIIAQLQKDAAAEKKASRNSDIPAPQSPKL